MKKINEYEKFKGILNYLKLGDGTLNTYELDLALALDDIMQIDRSNSIIEYFFTYLLYSLFYNEHFCYTIFILSAILLTTGTQTVFPHCL